jgi:hypothetical protein
MDDKKIITLAALGAALVELIAQGKNLKIGPALASFGEDFDAFCNQPKDLDQVQIKKLETALEEAKKQIDKYVANEDQAKGIIGTLKGQLTKAMDTKAAKTEKPTFDHDGVKYVINHGAHPHTVEEIQKSPGLQQEILAIDGQQAISKL